jgi:Fe2+ transport system protein B
MKRIAVLGMPNTGKSTFFNRLTGSQAHIGNWPGITIDLMLGKVKLAEEFAEVVDLPGIYDLRGFSQDEAVVRRFLESTPARSSTNYSQYDSDRSANYLTDSSAAVGLTRSAAVKYGR